LEKLRLNSAALRTQLRKCKDQLRQKEEIGEVLHAVDFEQLKIENSQYLAKIDEKNQEIQRLKAIAARTLHIVNSLKELTAEQKFNKKFQAHVESYHVPSIMNFVQLRATERQLSKEEATRKRKLKIAEMALIRHKKMWRQVLRSGLSGEV
uniref:Cilia- and flagella-associated protein 263 n=1 Tax=Echinostoma caproni TaxID=27848 RepID=A0A183B5T3_9TREM